MSKSPDISTESAPSPPPTESPKVIRKYRTLISGMPGQPEPIIFALIGEDLLESESDNSADQAIMNAAAAIETLWPRKRNFAIALHFMYNGEDYDKLSAAMLKSADDTLKLPSLSFL